MKKLLGTFIVLISLAGAHHALASENALHSSMMAISRQIHDAETIPGAMPDLKAIGPLIRRVIQTELRQDPGKILLLQQTAGVLEGFREMVGRTFDPNQSYNLRRIVRPLEALKTAFPNPGPEIQRVQEQLQGLHDDLSVRIGGEPTEPSARAFSHEMNGFFSERNTLQKAVLMGVILSSPHFAQTSYLNSYDPSTAIIEWKAPVLYTAPAVLMTPEVFEMVCPAINVSTDAWGRNLVFAALQNFAGKSVELVLKATNCLSPENAKAVGKFAKGLQAGKSLPGLLSAAGSNRIASHYAAKLQEVRLPILLSLFVFIKLFEQYSSPDMVAMFITMPTALRALDHWVMRPYIYKSAATATRYAVEKVLQQNYLANSFSKVTLRLGAFIPARLAARLSDGYKISTSKAATGLATHVIISVYEITADALSNEPEYTDLYSRGQRLVVDVTLGLTTNAIIGAVMPTALVTLTPYVVVGAFAVYYGSSLVYYVPTLVSYGSSFLW